MKSFTAIGAIGYLLFWFAGVVGYIINLWHIVEAAVTNGTLDTLMIFRIVGLFFIPLGAILGYV